MKITFENFKIFATEQNIELKPITILTGKNNSGKSSLIRLLLLLQNAFKKSFRPYLELNTKDFRLGNAEEIFNKSNKSKTLKVKIAEKDFQTELIFKPFDDSLSKEYYKDKFDLEQLSIKLATQDELFMIFKFNEIECNLKLSEPFLINNEDVLLKITNLEKQINELNGEISKFKGELKEADKKEDIEYIKEQIQYLETEKQNLQEKINILNNLLNRTLEEIPFILAEINDSEILSELKIKDNDKIQTYIDEIEPKLKIKYSDLISADKIFSFINAYNLLINNFLKLNFHYLPSLLHLRKRLIPKDEEISELIERFLEYQTITYENNNETENKLKKYLSIFKPINEISFKLVEGAAYKISIDGINLYDYGDGFKNIFEIVFPIVMDNENSTYIIEEPEIRLHPNSQSKLTDLFVKLYKEENKKFIIESHSEYFIRKLQYLVLKNEISKSDVVIYYLESDGTIRRIDINEDGTLSDDFGEGFFDEASKTLYNILIEQLEKKKNY